MLTRTVSYALAAALATTVPAAAKLKEGDPAPPMKIMKWVKGTPVTRFAKGKVYVVEFWATWCGPCRESIPHLTELARKNRSITFTGVDIWEREKGAARVAKVTGFVKDMGARMAYNVGMDDDAGTMAKTWMAASESNGIPTAFVVGKNGRIAWIGHPMQMDRVLTPIVRGTFNARAEARKRAALEAMYAGVQKAVQAKNFRGAVAQIDKFRASQPDMESMVGVPRYMYLLEYDVPAAIAYAKRLAGGTYRNDAPSLNELAYAPVDGNKPLRPSDYPILLAMAKRANALTNGKDANILDTLAAVYARSGDKGKALATQQTAVARLDKNAPAEQRKVFMDHLAAYKAQ